MLRVSTCLAVFVAAVLAAGTAAACRIGAVRLLFDKAPETPRAGVFVVQGDFTNYGPEYEAIARREAGAPLPSQDGVLIGVLRLPSHPEGALPVYANVTSCTHGFFGKPPRQWRGRYYMLINMRARPQGPANVATGVFLP